MALSSLGVYYLEDKSPVRCWWLVAPVAAAVTIVYTIVFLVKLNNTILQKDVVQEKGINKNANIYKKKLAVTI